MDVARGDTIDVAKAIDDNYVNAILANAKAAAKLKDKTVVVSCSGDALASPELKQKFCQDVAALQALGIFVVVVHGGGLQVKDMLDRLDVKSRSEGGVRESSPQVVQVAEMVIGSISKELSALICAAGGTALGLSGRDNKLLQCVKQESKKASDFEMVGKLEAINTLYLLSLIHSGICPVIGLIGTGMGEEAHLAYAVEGDDVVERIVREMTTAHVVFLTGVAGVLNKNEEIIPLLSVNDVDALIADKTITGGMISKVMCASSAVKSRVRGIFISLSSGTQSAFIVDGRVPHALLREVRGGGAAGVGTRTGGTVVTL